MRLGEENGEINNPDEILSEDIKKYEISDSDQEELSNVHDAMIKMLEKKSKEAGIDMGDTLERLSEERDMVKVYEILAEAISKF